MKSIKNLLTISLVSLLFVSCGTTKGYLGEKLPESELAIINGGSNVLTVSGKNYKEQVLIAKVDSLEVGNYYKGWPKNLKVKAGKHIFEIRHFRPWTYSSTYPGGGAIGGAISGSANEKSMTHHHYLISFTVKGGQSYLINFQTDSKELENPKIVIKNVASNETIEYVSEEKLVIKK
jgi:hypothetical protein